MTDEKPKHVETGSFRFDAELMKKKLAEQITKCNIRPLKPGKKFSLTQALIEVDNINTGIAKKNIASREHYLGTSGQFPGVGSQYLMTYVNSLDGTKYDHLDQAVNAFKQKFPEKLTGIVSNKVLDELLHHGLEKSNPEYKGNFWTGTLAAYEEPGKKVGGIIECVACFGEADYDLLPDYKWIFDVPKKFQGMKDVCFAVEHLDCDASQGSDGHSMILHPHEGKLKVIENFPGYEGRFLVDPATGIPINKKSDNSDPESRQLRRSPLANVSAIVRQMYDGDDSINEVNLQDKPSCPAKYHVLIESPARSLASRLWGKYVAGGELK